MHTDLELANNLLEIDINKVDIDIRMWESLSKYSTFKIGGRAKYVIKVSSREEIVDAVNLFRRAHIPFYILGGASNVLIDDKDWDGGVIITKTSPKNFKYTNGLVEVFSGDYLPALVHKLASWDIGGLEFLVGVPGTVGGAIVMNAGTQEKGICDFVDKIEVLGFDGKVYIIDSKDINWGYRYCKIPVDGIITRAWLRVSDKPSNEILSFIREHMTWRREHQPIGKPCAGSFFKNPQEKPAGYLIDKAGLKGYTVGGAQISEKHANFIINNGNATASDVLRLASHVKSVVFDIFGIELVEEVKFIAHNK